jgi:hypothetical protein
LLLDTIRFAEKTRVGERSVLDAFGIGQNLMWAGDIWAAVLERVMPDHPEFTPMLRRMLAAGTLASRISGPLRRYPSRAELQETYRELAGCLASGELFRVP